MMAQAAPARMADPAGTMGAHLGRDLVWALDPARFAAEALGMTPDPWQERVLRWTGQRLILMCSRQSGKSSTTSVLALHTALYQPGSLVLLISPSLRQSSELFRKVAGHLARLEETLGARPPLDEENKLSLQLANGARIVSLPSSEATIRGFSAVTLAIFDEDAFVSDDLYRAVRPMLAVSQGRLILMSTPFGKRGHFYHTWQGVADTSSDGIGASREGAGDHWERVKVTAYDCPRISTAFLAEERASLGALHFASEYLCEFVDNVNAVFSSELIARAFTSEVAPLFGGFGEITGDADGAAGEAAIRPLFGR